MKHTFFVPIYEWGDPNTGCGTRFGTTTYTEINELYAFENGVAVGHFEVTGVCPLLSEFKSDWGAEEVTDSKEKVIKERNEALDALSVTQEEWLLRTKALDEENYRLNNRVRYLENKFEVLLG